MHFRPQICSAIIGIAAALLGPCLQMRSADVASPAVAAPGSIGQRLFNDGWLFAKEDVSGADAPAFDDGAWRKLDLPHDWSIEGPFDAKWASATAFLPAGIAWYRKHFTLPAPTADQSVVVRFDGVYKNSTVYLNGHKLGGRPYGYSSFECNLGSHLNASGENVLAVRVDHHDFADSRWYPGSGIYRNVYLTVTGAVRVDHDGVFVATPEVNEKSATISVETTFRSDSLAALAEFDLTTRILDADKREVASVTTGGLAIPAFGTLNIGGGAPINAPVSSTFKQRLVISNPALWSVEHPALYTAVTEVAQKGRILDTWQTPFGIRAINFDPNTGFTLNGQSMKFKGVCLHEDAGALGAAIPRQVWERRLRILKEAGVNAIRTSHNPPSPVFLDLCDRMGFLVMDEAFDEWSKGKRKWMDKWNGSQFSLDGYHDIFQEWADRDLQDMVRRDRNHPSIVMWSVGNEIDYPKDPYPLNSPEPAEIVTRLIKDVKALDATRPVTAACAAIASNLFYPQLDIVGYNYQEPRYADDHAKFPHMVIYGSENKHDLKAWLAVENNPFISGQFLWTGIDYLGESRAWPNHANASGLLDLAGFPKANYYFRQSLWSDKPMVHIERARQGQGLVCYTNGDAVEFFQNDKSLGEKPLPADTRIIEVPAATADASIKAVAKKNGKPVAEETFAPAGPAAKISLVESKTLLGPGDGPNVAQIEVTVTDAAGVRMADSAEEITFSTAWPGRIIAVESGDASSTEDARLEHRKAFHGRLLVYVETPWAVTVEAHADKLPKASVRVGQ